MKKELVTKLSRLSPVWVASVLLLLLLLLTDLLLVVLGHKPVGSLLLLLSICLVLTIILGVLLLWQYRDSSNRRRMETALRHITAEFRAIFNSIPDAVIYLDSKREVVMVNPAFTKLFDYPPEEIMGKQAAQLYVNSGDFNSPPSATPSVREAREISFRRKSGAVFLGETVTTAVPATGGDPFGHIIIVRDITERKKAEAALSEAQMKLEKWVQERTEDLLTANEEIKRFAYVVSHDLRAPLVNVKGFAGELRHSLEIMQNVLEPLIAKADESTRNIISELLSTDIPESLHFIDSSASRMGNLIDAVLKLSRLGRRELHFERINMRVLIRKVLESLAHRIESNQIEVVVGVLPRVVGDATSLEMILANILENAVKYLDDSRPGKIEISGTRSGKETVFHIRDNGCGISEEEMPKVFEPFSRAGNQNIPGEGMGLAYVQTLIRRHGGRIWCESQPGLGTTFSFSIPNRTLTNQKHKSPSEVSQARS